MDRDNGATTVRVKQRCLIIDDSEVVRRVMRVTIEALDVEVEEASNSADAVALCRNRMPDFALLDWHLPGSNTLETLVALRSLPGGKHVKILYVSTNNDPIEIGRAVAAGAMDHMIKPFRRVTLEAKMAAPLSQPRVPGTERDTGRRLRRSANGG